jgi:hypothetical protein
MITAFQFVDLYFLKTNFSWNCSALSRNNLLVVAVAMTIQRVIYCFSFQQAEHLAWEKGV